MTISLVSTLAIGALLLLGFFNGLRRGGIREGTALIGILLGALLVEIWVERWGQTLHDRGGLKIENARWLVGLGLLFGVAIFGGYGSGLLIRRVSLKSSDRMIGALIGLLNSGLLISFALRYTQQFYFNERASGEIIQSWIRSNPLSNRLLTWIDLALVGAAAAVAIVSLLAGTIRLGRLVTQPKPKPASKPAGGQAQGAGGAKPAGGAGGASGAGAKPTGGAATGAGGFGGGAGGSGAGGSGATGAGGAPAAAAGPKQGAPQDQFRGT
jgi:hypothetical protein